jgi:hypothetical protein
MKVGDLAILCFTCEEAEMFYSIFTIDYVRNDVVVIESIDDSHDGKLVMYLSTHTGKRDWLRMEDFKRTFKIIPRFNGEQQ